ncbi:MAG TPA: ATP-binding protein [Fimbriimonadaceae bacterium]|nr:ATP-binding protein [Fimbriimonadaceae bacterium]
METEEFELTDQRTVEQRAQQVYLQRLVEHRALTDRLFAILALVMWVAAFALFVITASVSRLERGQIIGELAVLCGAGLLVVAAPVYASVKYPGHRANPFLAAISLMILSSLLVHVSGWADAGVGIFVMLAFLSFYRDGRVLAAATVVAILDLTIQSTWYTDLFVTAAVRHHSPVAENVAWLLVMDLVLYASLSRTSAGLRIGSHRQARLEMLNDEIEEAYTESSAALKESEAVKTIIFESAPDAVIRYDADRTILEANSAAERIFGVSRDSFAGKRLEDYFASDVDAEGESDSAKFLGVDLRNVSGRFFEGIMHRDDGTEFPAECYCYEVPGLEPAQYALFVRDITERKHLESQLSQAQKLESIGQLAAGIAHEINTPTQYIGDNTRFLQDAFTDTLKLLDAYSEFESCAKNPPLTPDKLVDLELVKTEADIDFLKEEIPKAISESLEGIARVSSIVSAMKDFSHPGVDSMTIADVNRILESTATVARNEWKYVAELELKLYPSLPAVACLPGEIGQVVLNLIINGSHAIAEKHAGTDKMGVITVESDHDDTHIIIRIGDTGNGIPERVRNRVFDPFFTTKEVGKGTGQGLAIAHNVVVERHGGLIAFETEEGKGTVFTIKLPKSLPLAEAMEEAA